ncbi:MAG: biotin/lipoyl-binding protein [Victivallales bacterium]|nr:biotin/lipoyl-binding protein [Victivallales bacterium]
MSEENDKAGSSYQLRRDSRTPEGKAPVRVSWKRRFMILGVLASFLAVGAVVWIIWYNICHVPALSARVRAAVIELSPRVDARLREVFVSEEDVVKKGDILARLDDTQLQSSLQGAQAELSIRESAFRQAQARERLTQIQVAADIAMARAQLAVTKAERASLAAELGASRKRLPQRVRQAETLLAQRTAEFDLLKEGFRTQDVESAKVRVASAKETLALYELEVRQSQELVDEGIDSTYTLEVRKTRLKTQQLALQEAELTLAKMEAGPRETEVRAAKRGLESEEAKLSLVRLSEVELTKLEKTLAIRDAEIQEAEARLGQAEARKEEVSIVIQQVAVAKAEMEKAKATVTGREAALVDLTVISPVDGIVTRVFDEVGELCKKGVPIIMVNESSKPRWIDVFVDEEDAQLVSVGQVANMNVPANSNDVVKAKVTQMGMHTQTLDGSGGATTQFGQPDRVWVKLVPVEPMPERVITGTTARGYIRVR